jgi:hypothetical protein
MVITDIHATPGHFAEIVDHYPTGLSVAAGIDPHPHSHRHAAVVVMHPRSRFHPLTATVSTAAYISAHRLPPHGTEYERPVQHTWLRSDAHLIDP